MPYIYLWCFRKNDDATNRIIANNKQCLIPTSQSSWKYIEDIPGGVKTGSQYKKQKLVNRRTFDTYFQRKEKEDIKRWLTAPDSEVRILKESDRVYVF